MSETPPFVLPAIKPPEAQLPFFKALHRALDNPMEGWPRAVYEELIYVPPRRDFRAIYVCDPRALRTVMLDELDNFPKSEMAARLLRPLLGDGVMTAEGARWREQRRIVAPAFHYNRIRSADAPMAAAADAAVQRWRSRGDDVGVNLTDEMIRITFEIILDAMLAGRDGVDIDEMSRRIATYLMHIGRPSIGDVLGAPQWTREFLSPQSAAAVRYLQRVVVQTIEQRRAGERRDDLVDLLMRWRDPETGRPLSDVDLRDNLLTFWAAGHETTAIALTWAIYLVANHPGVESRMLEEIEREAGDAPIIAETAWRLTYTKQVIQEAMRLYPPVPVMTRNCKRDTIIGDFPVKAGDIVVIPIYALHRHRQHWRDPERFDPDRFEARAGLDKRRFVYMPFGAGRRICIGAAFAMLEATVVLGTLLRSARFVADPAQKVRPLFRITMRPEGGLPMRIEPRSAPGSRSFAACEGGARE